MILNCFFLLVADSSLSASERCLPRSCLYIIRLIIWSSHQKSKSSLKEWLWEIFMFKNEHYIYRWSVSRACWLTYWSDKVGLGFFSVLFCSCSLGKEKNDLDRLSRYRTLDSRFRTEWKRLKRYLMSLFSYPYQRIAELIICYRTWLGKFIKGRSSKKIFFLNPPHCEYASRYPCNTQKIRRRWRTRHPTIAYDLQAPQYCRFENPPYRMPLFQPPSSWYNLCATEWHDDGLTENIFKQSKEETEDGRATAPLRLFLVRVHHWMEWWIYWTTLTQNSGGVSCKWLGFFFLSHGSMIDLLFETTSGWVYTCFYDFRLHHDCEPSPALRMILLHI